MKPGYFDRSQRLFTMDQTMAKLAERTGKPVDGSNQALVSTGDESPQRQLDTPDADLGPRSGPPDCLPPERSGGAQSASLTESEGSPYKTVTVDGESADKGGLNTPDVPSTAEPLTVPATPAALVWNTPLKATQTTQDRRYEVRGARVKDVVTYYAWSCLERVPKLLGYSTDPQIARSHCQGHADAQGAT